MLSELKRFNTVLNAYNKSLKLNPNEAGTWYNKGMVLFNLGCFSEALVCFDRVLELDPEDIEGVEWRFKTLEKIKSNPQKNIAN